ncbi:hypothetical protein SAMN04487936_108169 [Halobacillus dabanensis]|uniref:Uncharacterized protein n=1 Tax=Halobacillus dabanensis TaxID=240302 RepID=A0A1I3XFJ0_HALDA|nr:hypothetical protein [Halobacillus dabanensis]SFK18327.1 hypothetical protein SAMN04487936_108169 [Halobacillus dabanensis]
MVQVYEREVKQQTKDQPLTTNPVAWLKEHITGPYVLESSLSARDLEHQKNTAPWLMDALQVNMEFNSNVAFSKTVNFIEPDVLDGNFNTIVIQENLLTIAENKDSIKNVIDRIWSENGKLILLTTEPNRETVHERMYLINQLISEFSLGRLVDCFVSSDWAGIVFANENSAQDTNYVSSIIKNSLNKENELIYKVRQLENYIEDLQQEKISHNDLAKLIKKQATVVDKIKQNQEKDKPRNTKSKDVQRLTQQLIKEKEQKVKLKEQIIQMFKKEALLLKSHRKLIKRYESLSTSKLGRMTIAYWKFINRIKRGK